MLANGQSLGSDNYGLRETMRELPISGVGLPRTQRLAPPIGPSTINFGNFVHLGFRVQPLAGNPTSNSTACDAISYTPEQGIYFVLAGN